MKRSGQSGAGMLPKQQRHPLHLQLDLLRVEAHLKERLDEFVQSEHPDFLACCQIVVPGGFYTNVCSLDCNEHVGCRSARGYSVPPGKLTRAYQESQP